MKINKIIVAVAFVFIAKIGIAQESLPFYQQYLLSDKVLINPSYAGATEDVVVKLTYHKQWNDFDLSPNTQTAIVHANVVDRVGIGAYFFKDENGPVAAQGLNLQAAYHIPLGDDENRTENQFSFGTGLSLWSQSYDWRRIKPENPNDPLVYGDPSIFLPYLNLGASFAYKGFFGGISITDIPLSNNSPIVNEIEPSPTWYYLNLGYDWKFSNGVSVEPSVLMNINTNSERHLDANVFLKYATEVNRFAAGVSYRQDLDENGSQALTVSPMLKADIGKFNFGFSYNIGLSDIATYGGNGFMIGVGYNLDNFINQKGFRYK